MADVELVVKIPESRYRLLQKQARTDLGKEKQDEFAEAVLNGMSLPKGHGRLLDEKDILDTQNNNGGWYDLVDMPEYIAGVKAIIAADK